MNKPQQIFIALVGLLSTSSAHATPQTATINGGQISYEVCGEKNPQGLILLHDGLANSALWDFVWPGLCEKFHAVRYDRRGYGRSPVAKEQHWPVQDLEALMKHVGLAHAHFIGAFSGAGIVLDFLFENPEAVDKLVFIAPNMAGFPPNQEIVARLQGIERVIQKADTDATAEFIAADPYFIWPGHTEARAKLAAILKATPGDLGAHPKQVRSAITRQRLPEVYAPTLILVGAADDPYNLAVAAAVQREMRAAKLTVIPDTGQLLYLEEPGAFVGLVTEFLN